MVDKSARFPFVSESDPAAPGWDAWRCLDPGRYNALLEPLHLRVEGGTARVRMTPDRRHSNFHDAVHGGVLLGLMDVALFAASHGLGALTGPGVTLDLSAQFIGAARIGAPLEARVELLRETGRLLFLRGLLLQEDQPVVASFSGAVRKVGQERTGRGA